MAARTTTKTTEPEGTEPESTEPQGAVETTDGVVHEGEIPADAAVESSAGTTLDEDTTKPSVTEPGDGPADTTDPTELATSVTPQPGDEAIAAGTVNAVKPVKRAAAKKASSKERTEKYEAIKPNGEKVTIVRNIETGETSVDES